MKVYLRELAQTTYPVERGREKGGKGGMNLTKVGGPMAPAAIPVRGSTVSFYEYSLFVIEVQRQETSKMLVLRGAQMRSRA